MDPVPCSSRAPLGPLRDRIVEVGGSALDLEAVARALGEGLFAAGYAPRRVNLCVVTLHPALAAVGLTWTSSGGPVLRQERAWGFLDAPEHRESPLHAVMSTRRTLRLRIGSAEVNPFSITRGFAAEGATDYIALPIPTARGDVHALTVWTDRVGGWSPEQVADLDALLPTLSLIVDLFESRRIARTVCETYLGPRAGPRVLAGQVHRGASERIRAAVWFSDLRSFTDLTEVYGDAATVSALDGWFELAVEAVQGRGGEVLKFIGDALLAIFPVKDDAWDEAVEAAVDAALWIRAKEVHQASALGMPLTSGVAIHTGEVLYGNVGAPGRLDFTVLGSAVNRAARISGLCSMLRESTLLSERAAASFSGAVREAGSFPLKGFPEATKVYAPVLRG